VTYEHHSAVFLEENVRLYTSYCATVSLSLFSASANKFYRIHLVYSGYHENVPVNFMTNWLKRGVPVCKPLLVVIWQVNISDPFSGLAITKLPFRLVIPTFRLEPIDCNDSRTHLYSETKNKAVNFSAPSKQSHTLTSVSVRNNRVTAAIKKKDFGIFRTSNGAYRSNSNSIVRI